MFITQADRDGARRVARARTQSQHRSRSKYPVTVGGIVVGLVEKLGGIWYAEDETGFEIPGGFQTRREAVAELAKGVFAAHAYRESAREGTHGTAEERRVRTEDDARLAAIDAELDEQVPVVTDQIPRTHTETMTIKIVDAKPRDRVVALDGQPIVDGPTVRSRVEHVGRPDGPMSVRLEAPRSTAAYLYVDQYPKITVERTRTLPTKSIEGVLLIGQPGGGSWISEDGRFYVRRDDELLTLCENEHPGCGGGQEHFYSAWAVWDNAQGDYINKSPDFEETLGAALENLAAFLRRK